MPRRSKRAYSEPFDDPSSRYRIEAITRAVNLLRQFNRKSPRRSVDELCRALSSSASLTRRMLRTLEQHRLVRCVDATGDTYELGLAWLHFADIRRRQVDMRQLALPVMRRVRDTVNETVILSIRVGYRRINVDYVESTQALRRLTQLGFEAPLHIGAAGRALMAGLSPDQIDDYCGQVPLHGFRNDVAIDKAALLRELNRTRRQGFALSCREITSDTAAVAAPVFDHTRAVVAALTISCPDDRFTPGLRHAYIDQVTRGAEEVSLALGFNPAAMEENRAVIRSVKA
jgi:IclR family transcriptional regulator, KDG regulon repressor